MKFINIKDELPKNEGKYIVKTKVKYGKGNVLEINFHYDKDNKPCWGCYNQIVNEWLKMD